jgi:hydrogenase nickel incorporation protein HypA/HybF
MKVHEVSIALGMVDELTRIARENNAVKVIAVNLKIGKLSGIVTDSLQFAFDAVKLEHPLLSSSELLIEEVPLICECKDCGKGFNTDDTFFPSCPGCGSFALKVISGEEMDIANMELEI